MTTMIKPGVYVELHGTPAFPGFPGVAPEMAKIARWTARSGDRSRLPGYHVVQFATGGKLLVHETSFRVVDNR